MFEYRGAFKFSNGHVEGFKRSGLTEGGAKFLSQEAATEKAQFLSGIIGFMVTVQEIIEDDLTVSELETVRKDWITDRKK